MAARGLAAGLEHLAERGPTLGDFILGDRLLILRARLNAVLCRLIQQGRRKQRGREPAETQHVARGGDRPLHTFRQRLDGLVQLSAVIQCEGHTAHC